ncbi:hypothetical protein, partial [Salmonella sp. SAL4455]|uniref:hypothetical protein n=1 Tax=Salmonella sp. SAL4455 TaxID=3159910 RepID=UPI00397CA9F7
LQSSGQRRPLVIEVSAGPEAITGDLTHLRQAMGHLAGYLMRRPGSTRLTLTSATEGEGVSIVIAADGETIPAAERERLFEP